MIGRMILKKMLGRPELKERIIAALRAEASKTDTKIDDSLVDATDVAWDIVIPLIVGKL